MKKNLLLMLFASCMAGTTVANASSLRVPMGIEQPNRPATEIISSIAIGNLKYNLDTETKTAELAKNAIVDVTIDDITVPETVEFEGVTYTVTSIANGAFQYRDILRFVTLPETITKIDDRAFIKCIALESVNFPNSVTYIGARAFKDCECLLEAILPENLETLGEEAFYNCASLRKVEMFDKVTEILNSTFGYCRALSEINLPSKLVRIGNQAFYSCQFVTDFNVPETVEEIGEYAFGTCVSLTNIYVPSKVTEIKDGTYINCIGIKSVDIPDRITKIGYSAFAYCEALENITIGSNVEFIGATAFNGCPGSFVTFKDGDKPCLIDNTNLGQARVSAFDGVQIAELYIGREVQYFNDWKSEFFKTLTLGPNLKVWHDEYCQKQAVKIVSKIQDPTVFAPVFDNKIYEETKLVVPVGTLDAYSTAEGWKNFAKIIDEAGTPAAIEGVATDGADVLGYFSEDGIRSDKPMKGLNIVKLSNGATKKIFIK